MKECHIPGCENIVSMQQWIENRSPDGDEECTPCMLGLTSTWYEEELREHGREDIAQQLFEMRTKKDMDVHRIAQKLDEIKKEIDPALRCRLLDFDCATQLAKP